MWILSNRSKIIKITTINTRKFKISTRFVFLFFTNIKNTTTDNQKNDLPRALSRPKKLSEKAVLLKIGARFLLVKLFTDRIKTHTSQKIKPIDFSFRSES